MEQKPGDFFIGVVNFFAILLPGAVLSFFSMGLASAYANDRRHIFGFVQTVTQGEVQRWVIFIIASYLLGQFVFLLGSPLDKVYNLVRKGFMSKRIRISWLRKKWVKNEGLYNSARAIKSKYVENSTSGEIVNTFQWAKANVQLRFPAAADEIHRLEADQKFFRGLIVVLVVICMLLVFFYKAGWLETVPYVVVILLSFWRYVEQRRKSTNLAYIYLIAMEKLPKETASGIEGKTTRLRLTVKQN